MTQGIKFRAWHKKEGKMYYRGYQRLWSILLCEDDQGAREGRGIPVQRASYEDCELLESMGLVDQEGKEVFEGDIVRVSVKGKTFVDTVGAVPDMYRSRKLHPLHDLLMQHGIPEDCGDLELEVLGNRFEHSHLLAGS